MRNNTHIAENITRNILEKSGMGMAAYSGIAGQV